MPDLEFFVPPPIVAILLPGGVEIVGKDRIRAHMQELTEKERSQVRCRLEGGSVVGWDQMNDPGAGL